MDGCEKDSGETTAHTWSSTSHNIAPRGGKKDGNEEMMKLFFILAHSTHSKGSEKKKNKSWPWVRRITGGCHRISNWVKQRPTPDDDPDHPKANRSSNGQVPSWCPPSATGVVPQSPVTVLQNAK
jgi:hypothetical protein